MGSKAAAKAIMTKVSAQPYSFFHFAVRFYVYNHSKKNILFSPSINKEKYHHR